MKDRVDNFSSPALDEVSKLRLENLALKKSLNDLYEIVNPLMQDADCDHEVDICFCGVSRVIEEAEVVLGIRAICKTCGGTGSITFDDRLDEDLCVTCYGEGTLLV